ncbi:MAG: hypothetical protein HY841_00545 [Bacteroidetes bacterium]|nr:hypothetical protein [Bacteroidota bacterium]
MKTKHSLVWLILISVFAVSTGKIQTKSTAADTTVQKEKITYQCPMKCEGEKTYDKSGKCPKCGMDLANKTSAGNSNCKMQMKGKGMCCSKANPNEKKTTSQTNSQDTLKAVYTCPMHPEIKSDKPGKCPQCKMDLVKQKNNNAKEITTAFQCPMKCEGEKTYDKKGNCPKCGMYLKEK